LIAAAYITLPQRLFGFSSVDRKPWDAWVCTIIGLFCGLIIGLLNDQFTGYNSSECVKDIGKLEDS
jgi:Na+/H+-translocating membrane pyrophosphatase